MSRADALKSLYAPALVINDQTAKWLIFNHKAAFVCLEKHQTHQTKISSKDCKSTVWLSVPVKTKQSNIHKVLTINCLQQYCMFKHLPLKLSK